MIKILEILSALNQGGVDRIIYDYSVRFSTGVLVDFVISEKEGGLLEKSLLSKGFHVYHISKMRERILKHCKELDEIIKREKYDVVHDNNGYKGVFNLFIAKKNKTCVRIAHSHFAYVPESLLQKLMHRICSFWCSCLSTHLFACGQDAAVWMWGKKRFLSGKIKILKNAIDTHRFIFNSSIRDRYRKELGLNNCFCVGCVARFRKQKNHFFLIKVFQELLNILPNSKLVLVGEGDTEQSIKDYAEQNGFIDKVLFLGVRDDVNNLLNAFDVFLLTSLYEGLPIVMVEAQCNGLPMVVSNCITKEISLLETTVFLPLNIGATEWANQISTFGSFSLSKRVVDIDYDISKEAAAFEIFLKKEVQMRNGKKG